MGDPQSDYKDFLVEDLVAQGMDRQEAVNKIYTNGYWRGNLEERQVNGQR